MKAANAARGVPRIQALVVCRQRSKSKKASINRAFQAIHRCSAKHPVSTFKAHGLKRGEEPRGR
jgi:hypothetical protein